MKTLTLQNTTLKQKVGIFGLIITITLLILLLKNPSLYADGGNNVAVAPAPTVSPSIISVTVLGVDIVPVARDLELQTGQAWYEWVPREQEEAD